MRGVDAGAGKRERPRAGRRCTAGLVLAIAALAVPAAAGHAAPTQLDSFGDGLGPAASGVVVSPSGLTYVADTENNRVLAFTPDGAAAGVIEGEGSGEARINQPVGIARDATGDLFISENGGDRLLHYTAEGVAVGETGGHGTGDGELRDPAGVAIAEDGTVLVADRGNARIQAFGADGSSRGVFGASPSTAPELLDPYGIAVGPDGAVFVTDRAAGRVLRFAPDGSYLDSFDGSGTAAGALDEPTGIAIGADGLVHVADAGRDAVVSYTPGGVAETWSATPPLDGPSGVAVDCRGSVYVVDSGAQLVRRFGQPGATLPPCVLVEPPAPVRISARSTQLVPVLGVSLLAEPQSGTVRFRRPKGSTFEPLTGLTLLPVGTRFDTTNGTVHIILATDGGSGRQDGSFWGGSFTVFQGTSGPLTELMLADASARPLAKAKKKKATRKKARARAAARKKRKRSKLWGDAKGNFKTTGRNAAATVRGTRWFTEDSEDGTRVRVVEGRVRVRDLVQEKTVEVDAGEEYTARDSCASRRAFRIRIRVPVGVVAQTAIVRVNGRRVRTVRRAGRLTSRIDLRGRPPGRQRVSITLVTSTGDRISGSRSYRTCDPERRDGAKPKI